VNTGTIEAVRATQGDTFNLPDGTPLTEYFLELSEPLEGENGVYTYSKKLVDSLQQGPQKVQFEWKQNQYKGRFIQVKAVPAQGNGSFGGVGSRANLARDGDAPQAREYHAAPETVALKLTEIFFKNHDEPDVNDIFDIYRTFLDRL
jgi:hypothetical protein